jgi:hypothetical protein
MEQTYPNSTDDGDEPTVKESKKGKKNKKKERKGGM